MPKIFQGLRDKFIIDSIWKTMAYIDIPIIWGGYMIDHIIGSILISIGLSIFVYYIKSLFDGAFGIKGKLIHQAFGIFDQSIKDKSDHISVYFKEVIENCSYKKIFFKISKESSFQIDNRTMQVNDGYFKSITESVDFILPKQIFTISLPLIEVSTHSENLEGILNIIFEYGEKETDLKYKAEFKITCDLIYKEENILIEHWHIAEANI